MNSHTDEWIDCRAYEHYAESLCSNNEEQIVGTFIYGDQNYGLDTDKSMVCSKLLVIPYDLENKDMISSSTHITMNNDWVTSLDIRMYFDLLKKQDFNSVEILFSKYFMLNPQYENIWNTLVENNELISRLNPYLMVENLYNIGNRAYKSLQKTSEDKQYILIKYGYNPEWLSTLMYIDEVLSKYVSGSSFEDCLQSSVAEHLIEIREGKLEDKVGFKLAETTIEHLNSLKDDFCKHHNKKIELSEAVNIIDKVEDDILAKFKENG